MNLKIKALIHTVGAFIIVGAGAPYIGSVLTHEQVMWIMASVVGGLFIYLVYGITHMIRLKYQATVEKLNQPVDQ